MREHRYVQSQHNALGGDERPKGKLTVLFDSEGYMEYDFTLKFRLPDTRCDVDAMLEALGAAGCNDAIVGVGVPGRLALAFTRSADSLDVAVASAVADVKRAVPSASLMQEGTNFCS